MDRFIGLTKNLIKNKIFNAFIFTLILLSAVIIGLETYPGPLWPLVKNIL